MVETRALVLNPDFTPHSIVHVGRAWALLNKGKAWLLRVYDNIKLRTVSEVFDRPAVIVLRSMKKAKSSAKKIRFRRENLFARDAYTCQYCGCRPSKADGTPDVSELTYDHVIPRSRARAGQVTLKDGRSVPMTSWWNIVACCYDCNAAKGARTPEEAGMELLSQPRKPSPLESVMIKIRKVHIPDEWREALPDDSPWRDYWTADLDES